MMPAGELSTGSIAGSSKYLASTFVLLAIICWRFEPEATMQGFSWADRAGKCAMAPNTSGSHSSGLICRSEHDLWIVTTLSACQSRVKVEVNHSKPHVTRWAADRPLV